jgi:hypothetical protein
MRCYVTERQTSIPLCYTNVTNHSCGDGYHLYTICRGHSLTSAARQLQQGASTRDRSTSRCTECFDINRDRVSPDGWVPVAIIAGASLRLRRHSVPACDVLLHDDVARRSRRAQSASPSACSSEARRGFHDRIGASAPAISVAIRRSWSPSTPSEGPPSRRPRRRTG